jgi:hypothetical protein
MNFSPHPERVRVDFGDLLIAIADSLDDIRQCIGCGKDSTWVGLFVDDEAIVSVSAWCDAPPCENDRVVMSAGHVLALPINHLPELRRKKS